MMIEDVLQACLTAHALGRSHPDERYVEDEFITRCFDYVQAQSITPPLSSWRPPVQQRPKPPLTTADVASLSVLN